MFEIRKEKQYGIATRGFIYRVFFEGEEIAANKDKQQAISDAKKNLLGAWLCQTNSPIVTIAADGTPISTREYTTGHAETKFHRPNGSDRKGRKT